jgi:ABC-type lipoprotein export system ATPase subunit
MSPILQLTGVSRSYRGPQGRVSAVEDVSIEMSAGDLTSVVGPSGCGKTTLLLLAGGLLRPDAGRVNVRGHDIYSLSSERRSRFRAANIGFVFQQFHLVPYLSVLDNILAPTLALSKPEASERARGLARRFGLEHRLAHVPSQLSTGERQRVALARACLNQPALLLADEPTGNLDAENGRMVLEHLQVIAREGAAVLLVTHDPAAAERATRVIRMRKGALLTQT